MLKWNLVLITVEAFFLLYKSKFNTTKIIFIGLTCLQAILLSGLRHVHVGVDTYNYYGMFERIKMYSWKDMWQMLVEGAFISAEELNSSEPGFLLTMKFFQIFSKSFRAYMIAFACFVNIPLFYIIYKNSKDCYLSVFSYMIVYFAFISTTGNRQTMAIVLMCMFGFDYIRKQKFIPFAILVLLGYFMHKSALVFIPIYFFAHKRINQIYAFMCILAVGLLFLFKNEFTKTITSIGGYANYGELFIGGAGTYGFSAIMLAIMLLTFWKSKEIADNCEDGDFYINSCILACMLLPTSFIDPSNLRAVFYYGIYSIFLIPEAIYSFKGRERRLVYIVVVLLMFYMYFKGEHIYRFYWQPGIYDSSPSIV